MKSLTRTLITTGLLALAGCNEKDGCIASVLSGTENYTNPTPRVQDTDILGFENSYKKNTVDYKKSQGEQ